MKFISVWVLCWLKVLEKVVSVVVVMGVVSVLDIMCFLLNDGWCVRC